MKKITLLFILNITCLHVMAGSEREDVPTEQTSYLADLVNLIRNWPQGFSAKLDELLPAGESERGTLLANAPISFDDENDLRPPLHLAAYFNNHIVIERLVANGALIDAVDLHGLTALDIAAREGNLRAVDLLLQLGANPNGADRREVARMHNRPVLGALARGHYVAAFVLLAQGAEIDLESDRVARIPGLAPQMVPFLGGTLEQAIRIDNQLFLAAAEDGHVLGLLLGR
jgi:hypothetical protein